MNLSKKNMTKADLEIYLTPFTESIKIFIRDKEDGLRNDITLSYTILDDGEGVVIFELDENK